MIVLASERREHTRMKVKHPAFVRRRDGSLHPCTVTDISNSGFRLQVGSPDSVPSEFQFVISPRSRFPKECKVVWRSGPMIGAFFITTGIRRAG